MATIYNTVYRGDFCDEKLGSTIEVFISRRMDSGDPTPIPARIQFAGANNQPVTVQYKDDGDYKLIAINGSACEVKIKGIGSFELSSLYTADEKEWRIDIDGAFKWSGYLIPDSCKEPYMSKPYDLSVTATDSLGMLKDLPFLRTNSTRYTGFVSDRQLLYDILAKTGLNIGMIIAVNTLESTMNPSICPLSQTFIDTDAFYQEDGTPFSCEQVILDILNRWSSRLHQFNGRWQIVNVLEKSFGDINTWEFDNSGSPESNFTLGNSITVGGADRTLQPRNASNSFAKALAESNVYYKYGYPVNQVINGSFDDCVVPGMPNGWTAVGTLSFFTYKRIDEKTGITTDDVKLVITSTDPGAYIICDDPVLVRSLEKVLVTFDLRSTDAVAFPTGKRRIQVLITDNFGNYFTNGGWKNTSEFYEVIIERSDFKNDLVVNFEVDPQTVDYEFKIGLKNVYSYSLGNQYETQLDNIKVQPQVSPGLQVPPLGVLKKYALIAPQSYRRDNILLLHGDEDNEQRTSRISIGSATVITPPVSWTRAPFPLESLTLLDIVADSELRMHAMPYRIFEAEYVGSGYIDINTLLTIDLLEGEYIFLSGTFDLKLGIHRLIFAQVLTDNYAHFEFPPTEDYGKGSNSSVTGGSGLGGSVGGSAFVDLTGYAKLSDLPVKASNVETQAGTDDAKFVTPLKLANWWAWVRTQVQTISAVWNFTSRPTYNSVGLITSPDIGTGWAVYTDTSHTSGAPLVINSGVTSTITNNAATVINTNIPAGVTSWYNSGTSKIIPSLVGDSYTLNIRFTAVSSSNTGLADVILDVTGLGVIDAQTISLRKGAGSSQRINVVFDVYSLATFVANGGVINLNSLDGNTSIYDITYKITRVYKAT